MEPVPELTRYEVRRTMRTVLSGIPIAFFGGITAVILLAVLLVTLPIWLTGLVIPPVGRPLARQVNKWQARIARRITSAFMRKAMGGKR